MTEKYLIGRQNTFRYKQKSKTKMLTAEISTQLPVYIFRVLHFGSMVGLSFKIISDYLRETVFIEYDMVFLLMTLISMGSGYALTFMLEPQRMGEQKKLWISWHNLKLLVTLMLFMPVYKFLPILSGGIVNARFYWLIMLIILSPAAKHYRDHFTKLNQFKKQ